MKDEAVMMALEIVKLNPFTVTACYGDEYTPTEAEIDAFEAKAAEIVSEATYADLCEVYGEVLGHGDGEEPVAPSTLLCWLGDRADDGKGIRVESINLETDR